MAYWLIKSEPFKYSWQKFQEDGRTFWDGVRNYAARNNLKAMKVGDLAFFYHSNIGKEIVGIAKITKEAFQDPTTTDDRWVAVQLVAERKLAKPISLDQIKADPAINHIDLVRFGRLSVQSIQKNDFDYILKLSQQ